MRQRGAFFAAACRSALPLTIVSASACGSAHALLVLRVWVTVCLIWCELPGAAGQLAAGPAAEQWADQSARWPSAARDRFLSRFDQIAARGFVTTRRAGSTGVGYTLESLLQIEENNSPRGDFLGMEIKAHRLSGGAVVRQKITNLFLKEPIWEEALTTATRVRRFGYAGAAGRPSWYQSVTSRINERGLRLQVDQQRQRVTLQRHGQAIGHWPFAVLQQRLQEKLREVVFVGARTRGAGASEQFHYTSVTWCSVPSLDAFLAALDDGDVIVELRMHVKATGGGRNHGTAFRIRPDRLGDLYKVKMQCRPLIRQSATDGQ